MEKRCAAFILAAAFFVPGVLLSDGRGFPRQAALCLLTAGFLWMFARRSGVRATQIACAIAVASVGEVVLSLGWGLYTYRFALIPLYVPVGHGLFYALAAETARQDVFRRNAGRITAFVITAGTALAAGQLLLAHDQWGFLWWLLAAPLILLSENSLLLSVCFSYTMLLEWLGTSLGNWHWAATVPALGLHSANPPSGVGILYVLLDLITVFLMSRKGATLTPSLSEPLTDA